MKATIRNFLLAEDNFVSDMCLKQQGFTYSACKPFTKNEDISAMDNNK